LLEGKAVDLKVEEGDDIDFEVEYCNDIDFWGEFDPIVEQKSKSERMKQFDNPSNLAILSKRKRFLIQKKDGTRIGIINHRLNQPYRTLEIVCFLIPSERGKGYGTEAIQLMVDYLFLSKDIVRIQAITNVRNKAAQRVLEKQVSA
jgi:RimJ/RimL family protein N-acetyltransferase